MKCQKWYFKKNTMTTLSRMVLELGNSLRIKEGRYFSNKRGNSILYN